ncbi:hypothetical protein [Sphingomonas sp. RS2018]
MAYSLIAAAAIGAAALLTTDAIEHSVRIDHPRGAVDARYTATVVIAHRQIGSVAPGGRASTLRCAWRADLSVDRTAQHARGTASRSIARETAIAGSRPGWCSTQARAIREEVAARRDEMRAHVLAVSREDRGALIADIDRAHAADGAG